MNTECTTKKFQYQGLGKRAVEGDFQGGDISSYGGLPLLSEIENRFGIIKRFSECFTEYRKAESIEHTVYDLLAQRIYGLALGHEDLNDHDDLRCDPLFATAVGKKDPTGQSRRREKDKGKALAGKSTLNRLELTEEDANSKSRYKKIAADFDQLNEVFVDLFLDIEQKEPEQFILDIDATDDPLHGNPEGRFFHGYYKAYCYMPLYIFCGDHPFMRQVAPGQWRWCCRDRRGVGAHCGTYSPQVESSANRDSRRQWFLPRRYHGLV